MSRRRGVLGCPSWRSSSDGKAEHRWVTRQLGERPKASSISAHLDVVVLVVARKVRGSCRRTPQRARPVHLVVDGDRSSASSSYSILKICGTTSRFFALSAPGRAPAASQQMQRPVLDVLAEHATTRPLRNLTPSEGMPSHANATCNEVAIVVLPCPVGPVIAISRPRPIGNRSTICSSNCNSLRNLCAVCALTGGGARACGDVPVISMPTPSHAARVAFWVSSPAGLDRLCERPAPATQPLVIGEQQHSHPRVERRIAARRKPRVHGQSGVAPIACP